MGLTDRIAAAWGALRADPRLTVDDWAWQYMNYMGNTYSVPYPSQTLPGGSTEEIEQNFGGYVQQAYKQNGVVFACMLARQMIFSEARFQFRQMRSGRPGDLFGTADLAILEHPWPGATTGDLLARMIQDADMAGNSFSVRRSGRIRRMRPDWVSIVLGTPNRNPDVENIDLDAEVAGYLYHPGGRYSGREPIVLLRDEVCHFAPIPDPLAGYRGMSWMTPIVRDIMGDTAATSHKLRFYDNGATPNMIVSLDKDIAVQAFKEWVGLFKEKEPRGFDAYKTLYLGAGSTAQVVGRDMQQLEFRATQGAGETRIAAAAGIHPVIVGLSEGLAGSSLNAGNFQSARRLVADRTMSPLWRNAAGSMETIVPPPSGAQLWIDTRDIPFLREDRKDAAEIQQIKALTIRQLTDAGYNADSVVKAVEAEDMGLLKHSGLFSVQLQPPMPDGPPKVTVSKPEPALLPATTGQNSRDVTVINNFPEGFVQTHTTIEPTTINLPEQEAPVVNVTVPERNVEAAVVNVTVPEQPAPNITVEAPPPAQITVNVPEQPAPQVTVEAPPAAEVSVTVETESFANAVEDVQASLTELAKPRKRKIIRDASGRIVGLEDR